MKDMLISEMELDNMLTWLGTGIAERRKAAGLSCSQVARRVQLRTDVIHRLESGEYDLSVRELYAIVRALDSTLSDILG
jgi:ribosome-binding protein aMBF1 (putative translation factor)